MSYSTSCNAVSMQDVHNKLKNGIEIDESQNRESASLNPGDRNALVNTLSPTFPHTAC